MPRIDYKCVSESSLFHSELLIARKVLFTKAKLNKSDGHTNIDKYRVNKSKQKLYAHTSLK